MLKFRIGWFFLIKYLEWGWNLDLKGEWSEIGYGVDRVRCVWVIRF